ncbi:type II toxin-antitoxin system RelE/ParE family toxin [Butyrivibrio fibrisolvens]|uniref:type II toxin-antitoxin system RelE family toxin n=1 Tax=Pseudobutyrivibrio ruminis TaxID=46206 RepID=UPI000400010A|nr:type II toxin-antitoxin system RelE/ParE family toxin [Pseudobutyrivibrio ruminis]MDC7279545.1 type II toxin-antitoxin system RelE/ParE family toxin [Butyrivibrio fibrisolvens]
MKYSVELSEGFKKEFKRLDKYTQRMIRSWINNHLVDCEDPRVSGKPLKGNFAGQWRYRIGDYRLICEIHDNQFVILALNIGHRSKIYE